jgi:ATP-binding protein involved in chromosome partitioning
MIDPSVHNFSSIRHVVGIAAGKGGVGKSTLSLNLALYWRAQGFKVGLLDADLYGPSLQKMLPEEIPATVHPEIKGRIIPAECRGIKILSMAYFLEEGRPATVRAPIANGLIKQFIHQAEWGELDILVIDFPPGTGDIQLTLIQEGALSGAVLITTPQEIALLDVEKAARMFQKMQVPILGLVENMSYYLISEDQRVFPFGQGGGERFALGAGMYFLGNLPIDPEISCCCDEGKSLFDGQPPGNAARAFSSVAIKVLDQLEAVKALSGNELKNFDVSWKE